MNFALFFERLSWGAIAAIVLYAAGQLKDMSASVQALNTSVSVIIEKSRQVDESRQEMKLIMRNHEERLYQLERRR